MLSQEEVVRYNQEGHLVLPYRIPEEMIRCIERRVKELYEKNPELSADYVPGLPEIDERWLAAASIPEILDCVEKVIGPNFLNWGSSLFGKPAGVGQETPWHQDGEYWPIRPLKTCTVWIAIDDATVENGCLRVVPGSHKEKMLAPHITEKGDYTLYRKLQDDAAPELKAHDVVLKRGEVSIHDVYMIHGSRSNHSNKSRRGLVFRYMPTTSHFDYELNDKLVRELGVLNLSGRKLFLMRGVDSCGKNKIVEHPRNLDKFWDKEISVAAE